MLQLSKNPAIAYSAVSGEERLGDVDWTRPWAVAYTKPRQEKALAADLRERRLSYFLPMVLRETSSGGRRRKNLYPLFASYLFLADGEAERLGALKTERIVRFVPVKDAEQDGLRRELAALAMALEHCPETVELYAHLAVGTHVRVKSGAMRGVEGVVLDGGAKHKLWLGVSTLGVGATVEIHPDLVEAV
jgi:transcriptional antiterminator RfaH